LLVNKAQAMLAHLKDKSPIPPTVVTSDTPPEAADDVTNPKVESQNDTPLSINLARSREVIGGVGGFTLVIEGRHALEVLVEPLNTCSSARCVAAHICTLPDLAFGGFLLYSAILVSATFGVAWAMWPFIRRISNTLTRGHTK
jgi:hypothetical protein